MAIVNLYNNTRGVPEKMEITVPAHTGGEGSIFFSKDGHYAIKIYHVQRGRPEKRQFLERITLLGSTLTAEEVQFLCWPRALVRTVDGNERIGCVTRRISMPPYRHLIDVMLTPRQAAEQFRTGRSWANYLQIARGIARSVAVLNGKGCAHADLHFRNFLTNPENSDVVLLDLDGLVVPGFLPPQVAGMTGFMAPEIIAGESTPNERSDRHSLAVLVLHTLLFRNVMQPLVCYDPDDQGNDERIGWGKEAVFSEHPRDRRNCPRMLGVPLFQRGALSYRILTPTLQRLSEQALIDGLHSPDKRPLAQEWTNALSCALDELWRCSNCRLYFPYPHWVRPVQRRACPFCGQRIVGLLPSVLLLYEPRSRGNYVFTQRYLILGNGWQLFNDVLDTQRVPPMTRKREPTVAHVEWDSTNKTNRLVNDEGGMWHVRLGGDKSDITVGKRASLALQPGTTIHFGEGRRLLVVIE